MLVMADIVDYVELTFSIKGDSYVKNPSPATVGAIVFFTFVFILVTLLIHRAETPGQKVRFANTLPYAASAAGHQKPTRPSDLLPITALATALPRRHVTGGARPRVSL